MRSVITRLSLVFALFAVPALASAQDPGTAPAERGVVRLPDIVIPGRLQEPGAEYILTRGSGGRYEVRELRASFVREVVRTVHERPF